MSTSRCCIALLVILHTLSLRAEERIERFDRDPGWEGHNNRADEPKPRTVVQDFGYAATARAGSKPGEMGGLITPAGEPAYYAKKIATKTFDDVLTASGTLACTGRPMHVLVGFFNAGTVNEWRTPNTVALRLSGRGDVFYAWLEYATSRWRAGGDSPRGFPTEPDPETGRQQLKGFPAGGTVHKWSLRYDPRGNDGRGVVTATIGDQTAVCHLSNGHKADGATFNRFGLLAVSKSADAPGELWLDDVMVSGETEDFSSDPGWEGFHNRRTYVTGNVRPRFDFGFSPTQYAGGQGRGELGGLVFRGDCRYPGTMAYYGDRLNELTLAEPLRAGGKVCLRRGVTDSTVLVGFFHSRDSMAVNPSQDSGLPKNFLGVIVDGPSREGFYFAPAYRLDGDLRGHAGDEHKPPHIFPDGKPRNWALEYSPPALGVDGKITVTLETQTVRLDLNRDHAARGAHFDRFGIITTWIDGNGQHIYFDDLTYTCRQDEKPDRVPVGTVAGHAGSATIIPVPTGDEQFKSSIYRPSGPAALGGEPIRLGSGPHLFIDDYLIHQSSNVKRRVNCPLRDPQIPNPLITGKEDRNFQPYVSVLRDEKSGRFRIWYVARKDDASTNSSHMAYLESEDGVRWIRPPRILEDPAPLGLIQTVIDEGPDFRNPDGRFKLCFWTGEGLKFALSPDGLNWNLFVPAVVLRPNHDISNVFYDRLRQRYVATISAYTTGPKWTGQRRTTLHSTSKDFSHWEEPWYVVSADDSTDPGQTQFYAMHGYLFRGDLLIGLVKVLHDDWVAKGSAPGSFGVGYTTLAWTRDGEHWVRDQTPYFEPDPTIGAWDHAHAWMDYQVPVGDEVYIYYGGYKNGHKMNRFEERQIGLVRIRRDRYVSREAGADGGTLRTPAVVPAGQKLTVNANVRGELRVRLLDAAGRPIAGFDAADCRPIQGDSLDHALQWKNSLATLRDKPVQIEFVLQDAELYGFDLQ